MVAKVSGTDRSLTRTEYDALVAAGCFDGQRLELLRGRVVAMSPIGARHREVVYRLMTALTGSLTGRARVEVQQPLIAADESEPEPDVVVIAPGDYGAGHPRHAFLVVEVAETSLQRDLVDKAAIYAASAVDEYWVVDLVGDVIHVHRRAPTWGGWIVERQGAGRLAPAAFADAAVELGALFPRRQP